MSDRLELSDDALMQAGHTLVVASYVMTHDNVHRPTGLLASVSGVGPQLDRYLRGLAVARAALADAARTASEGVAAVMSESTELDSFIAVHLGQGFALKKGKG